MSTNSQTSHVKGSILVVDDILANLRLLTSMLAKRGYLVRPIRDSRMVLSAVSSFPPDLILLDISMPYLSGYQVCQQLKANQQTADIPVIFLSALSEVLDKVQAFSLGGVDYITKPFQVQEVLARVETHIALLDDNYQPFAHRLKQLANELRERELLALVERYYEGE